MSIFHLSSKRSALAMLSTLLIVLLSACNTVKYVPDGEYLLDKVKIEGDLGSASRDELNGYIRQQPNARVLGFWRLRLHIYNLSGTRDTGWNRWLRKIASEGINQQGPVIYDSTRQEYSRNQLELFMRSKGYYDVTVTDSMQVTGDKKCEVTYNIDAGKVYRISHFGASVADDSIRSWLLADTVHSLIKVGDPFDANVHDDERSRIMRIMHEKGYYGFSKNHIIFQADTTLGNHLVRDSMIIIYDVDKNTTLNQLPHRQWLVKDVIFNISHQDEENTNMPLDSTTYGQYRLFYHSKPIFNSRLLANSCFIKPGQFYNVRDVELTSQRFNGLKLFTAPSIDINPVDEADSLKFTRTPRQMNVNIALRTRIPQSFSVDVEGTNSSGNLGGAISLGYRHNNIFHNAEVFDVKVRLAMQNQFARDGKERFFTIEYGANMSLAIPNLIAPFVSAEYNRKRNPTTNIILAYDYQRRPDFTKSAFIASLVYNWVGSRYASHAFTPVEFDVVNIPTISSNFKDYIKDTYLQYSYRDHFIMSLNYTFLFNQQKKRKSGTAWYVMTSLETAGNTLSAITHNKNIESDGSRHLFNISFSQYVKADVEIRLRQSDFWGNNFVYRFYGGIGIPYGNSKTLPFEKSYYVGGANSIRAWPVRGLGPGSEVSTSKLRYHNQIGDIRLEMNAEYRFKMISALEGAIFADAGNIWDLKKTSDNPESVMTTDFYKQIALGAGLGLRLNFGFLVIRLDAASKMHDPSKEEDKRWVIANEHYNWNKINFNFAIGYPF
ncbi:MAG: outer membrane protein assembly factor [Bacteroidales bacterium]|nr:outer membrane protein assembly factor [Bacteroidales bacterium]